MSRTTNAAWSASMRAVTFTPPTMTSIDSRGFLPRDEPASRAERGAPTWISKPTMDAAIVRIATEPANFSDEDAANLPVRDLAPVLGRGGFFVSIARPFASVVCTRLDEDFG